MTVKIINTHDVQPMLLKRFGIDQGPESNPVAEHLLAPGSTVSFDIEGRQFLELSPAGVESAVPSSPEA